MATLVMKFGGASVETISRLSEAAALIVERLRTFDRIAVVVSAMGNTTNQLLAMAQEVNSSPPCREQDMLVSVGERISMSLIAMALDKLGCKAKSFTGSQSGIITCPRHAEARIIDVRPKRLLTHLDEGHVVIVAGFQGVSLAGEITTLGRGGSDTTAVALGIALGAEFVEFYKDVPGVYNKDPKTDSNAHLFSSMSYDEALCVVSQGGRILHPRSILLAQKNATLLHVRSFMENSSGTWIGAQQVKGLPVYEEV